MRNIIAVFDGLKYSESAKDYMICIAKQAKTNLADVLMKEAKLPLFIAHNK